MKLQGKVAVNSGIGFGIAEAFKNEGATGTITGRNPATLNQAVQELSAGFIDTPVFGKLVPEPQLEQVRLVWRELIPLGRMGLLAEMG